MATCYDCNAVYIDGITVCPACKRTLEPETGEVVEGKLVTILSDWAPNIYTAQASLESAGIPTSLTGDNAAFSIGGLKVTLQVLESDVEAAREILRGK